MSKASAHDTQVNLKRLGDSDESDVLCHHSRPKFSNQNTDQTYQMVNTKVTPWISQQKNQHAHLAFHMSDGISQVTNNETSANTAQMEDTKTSSKPAGQTITNIEKRVTNIQESYEVGMEKSYSTPPTTINIEQRTDVFKMEKIAQKFYDDASPTFGSNTPCKTEFDSSSKQDKTTEKSLLSPFKQHSLSDFTLVGARPKTAANLSSTYPRKVVPLDTISVNQSTGNVSKKDFPDPANEAMVHSSGNAHETQLQSNRDKHPLVVTVPATEELLNATGSPADFLKTYPSQRDNGTVKRIGNIFIFKDKVLGYGPNSTVFEGRLGHVRYLPVAVKRITCKSLYLASKTREDVEKIWKNVHREVSVHTDIEPWRHPNVVGYYLSQVALNKLYIAFQLCQGDLEDYVKKEFQFWRDNISSLEVNQNMAEGVRFLHSKSIVHRDLKPKNVFLVWQQGLGCRAVIGDLGMSKATDKGMYSVSQPHGSIGYMAPEVWKEAISAEQGNDGERSHLIQNKCDIFSLALLFFFTNTNGNHPFGNNPWQNQVQISGDCQPNFDQIRPEDFTLEDLLRKMFTRSPGSRPTAEEVCKHPALWDNEVILDFFCYCNRKVEAMAKERKPVDKIVPNNILPHGNWMRDLPDNLMQYLKQYRVNGKLPDCGRESSTRHLLCAIRNTAAHQSELPKEVIDDFGVHQAVFWNRKFPRLLTHLYNNIDYSDFPPIKDKNTVGIFPGKKTSLQNKSASNALAHMDDSQSAGNQMLAQQRTAAEETRLMPVQRGTSELTETERFTLLSSDKIIHPGVPFNNTTEESDDAQQMSLEEDSEKMINSFNIHGRDCEGTGEFRQMDNVIERPYCPLQVPFENDYEDMCNLPSASNLESKKERPFPSRDSRVKTHEREENLLTGRETMATDYDAEQTELLQKLPTDSALANLAEEITDYLYLARNLKMSQVEVKKVEHDHSRPLSNLIYHILYEWKKKRNNYLILYNAMKHAGCDTTNFFQIIAEEETDEEKQNVEEIKDKITDNDHYELSDQDINRLSRCIGEEYWLFGIRLGLTETEMQHISIIDPWVPSRVLRILLEYRKRYISIRKLILAMETHTHAKTPPHSTDKYKKEKDEDNAADNAINMIIRRKKRRMNLLVQVRLSSFSV